MNELPQALYQSILNHAPYGMAVVDGEGAVLLANARFASVLTSNGASGWDHLRGLLSTQLPAGWEALASEEVVEWEGRVELPDRKTELRVSIGPLAEGRARIVTVVDVCHERERERRAAAALKSSPDELDVHGFYLAILDNAPDGVFVADPDGLVEVWAHRMETMYGISSARILGRSLFDEVDSWQAHSAAFQRVLDTREPVLIDRIARVNHNGTAVVESISLVPLWQGEMLKGVLGRVSDVSEQADLEKQLIKSERMAAVGELAAGVAHNFNNILAGIGGDAQLLRMIAEEDKLGDAVINSAEMIYRETMRGGRIAHDLLSFARGQEPCLSEVDISVTVGEAVRLAKTYPQAAGVELRPLVPTGLPRVSADPNQLHQVFFNIILNAIQAMPHGGSLTIDSRIVSGHDGLPRMEVMFQDTGVGIPEDHLNRIFDPFFTNRRSGAMGTGLGLSVSQSMVRGMNGEIKVESQVGHGTLMTVVLPVVERRKRPRNGEAGKTRILLADDEPTIRRTLSTFLSRRGYHVISARDGVEALGILEDPEAEFRMAIMDLLMPRMDGLELIRKVREMRPGMPMVTLTGVAGTEDLEHARSLGVRKVLSKPVDFDELLKTVEEYAGAAEIPVMA